MSAIFDSSLQWMSLVISKVLPRFHWYPLAHSHRLPNRSYHQPSLFNRLNHPGRTSHHLYCLQLPLLFLRSLLLPNRSYRQPSLFNRLNHPGRTSHHLYCLQLPPLFLWSLLLPNVSPNLPNQLSLLNRKFQCSLLQSTRYLLSFQKRAGAVPPRGSWPLLISPP